MSKKTPKVPAMQKIKGKFELFGAYNPHQAKLEVRFYKQKNSKQVIKFFELLRKRVSKKKKLIIILDNWRPHISKEIKEWRKNRSSKNGKIELTYLPTSCSWMNYIESIFSSIDNWALKGSNYKNVKEAKQEIMKYVRYFHRKRMRPEKFYQL